MDHPPILFIHIAKTAGTSLKTLLGTRIAPSATLQIPEGTKPSSKILRHVDDYELVVGHVSHSITTAFQRPPSVITFLREPVDRALSAYYFLRQTEGANIPASYSRAQRRVRVDITRHARELSLRDFLHTYPDMARRHMGSVQTAILSGRTGRRRRRPLHAADLARAKEHLEQCVAFGLTERVDESMTLICRSLGWAPFDGFPHSNPTRERVAVDELDAATLDELRELTQLDGELYRFAAALFERRWQELLASEPSVAATALDGAGTATFSFDRRIPGTGWYGSERTDDIWFSWTGPGTDSSLDVRPPQADQLLLRVSIVHALHPDLLHQTQLFVDDTLVEARVCSAGNVHHLEAVVPTSALRDADGAARITIRTPFVVRPCDLDPANHDSRPLGLAVSNVSLDRAAPGAEA